MLLCVTQTKEHMFSKVFFFSKAWKCTPYRDVTKDICSTSAEWASSGTGNVPKEPNHL